MVNHKDANSYVVVPYRYLERLAEIARINDITPHDALCYVMGRGLEIVIKESEKIVPKGKKAMKKKTQVENVLEYLQKHGSITSRYMSDFMHIKKPSSGSGGST